jgi:hypothetical protein
MLINRHGWTARSVAFGASMLLVLPTVTALHAAETDAPAAVEADAPAPDAAAADDGGGDAGDSPVMAVADALDEEPAYTTEELEALAAPIALYPDALLIQVLVASTFPLDVVRADRWVRDNPDIEPDAMLDGAEEQGWDPSVISLSAFPTVLQRMAEDLDWTEKLGDAMLLQSDGVLDAVQVLRAQAEAVGTLESNEYQTVSYDDEDAIVVAPADPEVVYVPQYAPSTVYVAQPATTTVVTTSGHSDSAMVATGVMAFTTGVILASIFNNNDRYGYYWGPSYGHVSWHSHRVYPPYYRSGGNYRPPHYRPPAPGYGGGGAWGPRPELRREARGRADTRRDVNRNVNRDVNRNVNVNVKSKDRARSGGSDRTEKLERQMRERGRDAPGAGRTGTPQRPAAGKARPAGKDRKATATRQAGKGGAFGDRASHPETRQNRDRGAKSRDAAKRPADRRGAQGKPKAKPQGKPRAKPQAKPQRKRQKGGAFDNRGGGKAARHKSRGQSSARQKRR